MESASTQGSAVAPPSVSAAVPPPSVSAAVRSLRWTRPDLAGALAEHLAESASAVSDRDAWLLAAGWRVHAAAAVGDGREIAADALEALPRWGADALSAPAAARLRLELAVLAHGVGENLASRALLDTLPGDGADAELVADTAVARLRCRDDGPLDPADALAAWARVGGAPSEIGSATALLVAASADRRLGRSGSAVTRAVDGLDRLDRARTSPQALSPSPHLAAALAAEWISSLIAAGRSDQAGGGSRPLRARLVEHARPTRQLALLRLTLTRVVAAEGRGSGADVARELERAAHDAAASDAPELEFICRTALGEVHEKAGRPEASAESVRLAVVAERRHRARVARFRTMLVSLPGILSLGSGTGAQPASVGPTGDPKSAAPGADALRGRTAEPERGRGEDVGRRQKPESDAAGEPGRLPGSVERTAKLRAVQAASMADNGSARAADTAVGAADGASFAAGAGAEGVAGPARAAGAGGAGGRRRRREKDDAVPPVNGSSAAPRSESGGAAPRGSDGGCAAGTATGWPGIGWAAADAPAADSGVVGAGRNGADRGSPGPPAEPGPRTARARTARGPRAPAALGRTVPATADRSAAGATARRRRVSRGPGTRTAAEPGPPTPGPPACGPRSRRRTRPAMVRRKRPHRRSGRTDPQPLLRPGAEFFPVGAAKSTVGPQRRPRPRRLPSRSPR